MSGGQTKNAALTTALAFHYQMLIGLDKCFSLEDGQSIWFEKDGDVSLISPNTLESTQSEVKNYLAPLTDHHENLWKTLKNWLTPEFDHSQYGVLVLHTKTIRRHKPLILNWFKAKKAFSSGVVEGLNNKAKVTTRNSYGFRTYKCAEIALYHALGNLPTPPMTHRFC